MNEERRTVLMFAYYFPPCTCWPTASMRAEGLAKGLIHEGWDPIVVTRSNGCACLERTPDDSGTEGSSGQEVEVRRVEVHPSFLVRLSAAVDRWCESGPWRRVRFQFRKPIRKARALTEKRDDWTRRAFVEGSSLLRERGVEAVWTTSGPYRTIGIGRRLQRRDRKPWVADLRDSVARDRAWIGRVARIAGRRQRKRWFRALKKASVVIDVSPQEAEIDSAALGREVHSLPSGFDMTVWEPLRIAQERPTDRRAFQILYAGAFYGDRVELGGLVFRGLRLFLERRTEPAPITLTYIGRDHRRFLTEAAIHGCEDLVEDGGVVPPAQARQMMVRADLLLLLIPTTQEGGMPGGKLYEYLAAGPPILAVHGTDPYVMAILRETRAGDGASTPEDIAEVVGLRYEDWRVGRAVPRPLDGLADFTWAGRAHELAHHLDSLASPGSRTDLVDPIEGVLA